MKRIGKSIAAVLCLLLALLPCACSKKTLTGFRSYSYFNTETVWAYEKRGDDERMRGEIEAYLSQVEAALSLTNENGAISRFNRAAAGEEVEIDEYSYETLRIAQKIFIQTDGAFNPATGALIDLWGFSPRHNASDYAPSTAYDRADYRTQLPQEEYISAFCNLTDFSAVELSERAGKYYALKPPVSVEVAGTEYTVQLNLGGIGKGYCVDGVAEKLRAAGYATGYFSLGASSMYVLECPASQSKKWEVSVRSPRQEISQSDFMRIKESNAFLSTGGDTDRYYELNGVRYCHIIDPQTGYPVNVTNGGSGIVFATVCGLSAAEGDATATALIAMGKERAIAYAKKYLADCRVYFVYRDGQGRYELHTNSNDYELCVPMGTVRI